MPNYQISKHPSGGYQSKKEGGQRASIVGTIQADVIRETREIMHNNGGGELRIHSVKGPIRASDTVPPKNDPFPPRG